MPFMFTFKHNILSKSLTFLGVMLNFARSRTHTRLSCGYSATECRWRSSGTWAWDWISGEDFHSFGSRLRGFDSLKLASRCVKTLSQRSDEQKHLDNGLCGPLLAMRFRRKSLPLQTSVPDFLKSSSVIRVLPPVLLHTGDDNLH
jgi:hypothetical protein